MKKFFLIVNAFKDRDLKETYRMRSYIETRGGSCSYLVSVDGQVGIRKIQAADIPEGTECILVLGGDGTLIRAARDTVESKIPLIGVNMGTLGYLCELEPGNVYEGLDAMLHDEYMLEERMMLCGRKEARSHSSNLHETGKDCSQQGNTLQTGKDCGQQGTTPQIGKGCGQQRTTPQTGEGCDQQGNIPQTASMVSSHTIDAENEQASRALNDIVIHRTGALSLVSLTVYVNGQYLNTFNGDGVILSTPTGSTGYNMSAGGPIVDPKAQLLLLTPINCHTLNQRSIVIGPQDEIIVEVESRRTQRDETVEVSFDGDHGCWLEVGDYIRIRKAEESAKILKLSKISFLEILRKKMQTFR